MRRGNLWLVVAIVFIALYTPFMKRSLSIMACDPTYQCQFQRCWEAPDRLFILAEYLCFVIVREEVLFAVHFLSLASPHDATTSECARQPFSLRNCFHHKLN